MIECGIRSTGITIGGGRLAYRANASTSTGREPPTVSEACRSFPKWPFRLSSAATTTAGGCSREDGQLEHRHSSHLKLRFTSVASRSDYPGSPVKAISPGRLSFFCFFNNFLKLKQILMCQFCCVRYHLQRPPDNRLNCSVNPSDEEYQRQVLLATNYWTNPNTNVTRTISIQFQNQVQSADSAIRKKPKIWRMKNWTSNSWPAESSGTRNAITSLQIQFLFFKWKKNHHPSTNSWSIFVPFF